MSHYNDGTLAKVGDQVFGKLYNTEGPRAGVLVSISPGHESCNAMVQFTEVVSVGSPLLRMELHTHEGAYSRRPVKTEMHGTDGPEMELATCLDYTETKNLTKV